MGEKNSMKLLRTEQVGEILSFSPKKIRQMIMNGEIPSLKIGGEYRVKEEDLLTYINNQVVTA
jgi:excisionase family DNA binding protein